MMPALRVVSQMACAGTTVNVFRYCSTPRYLCVIRMQPFHYLMMGITMSCAAVLLFSRGVDHLDGGHKFPVGP